MHNTMAKKWSRKLWREAGRGWRRDEFCSPLPVGMPSEKMHIALGNSHCGGMKNKLPWMMYPVFEGSRSFLNFSFVPKEISLPGRSLNVSLPTSLVPPVP